MDSILEVLKASGPFAVFGLGWWLSGRFRYIENGYQSAIDKHEMIDQKRHEQNIKAMERIRLVMARAGLWNGHPPAETDGDE